MECNVSGGSRTMELGAGALADPLGKETIFRLAAGCPTATGPIPIAKSGLPNSMQPLLTQRGRSADPGRAQPRLRPGGANGPSMRRRNRICTLPGPSWWRPATSMPPIIPAMRSLFQPMPMARGCRSRQSWCAAVGTIPWVTVNGPARLPRRGEAALSRLARRGISMGTVAMGSGRRGMKMLEDFCAELAK